MIGCMPLDGHWTGGILPLVNGTLNAGIDVAGAAGRK